MNLFFLTPPLPAPVQTAMHLPTAAPAWHTMIDSDSLGVRITEMGVCVHLVPQGRHDWNVLSVRPVAAHSGALAQSERDTIIESVFQWLGELMACLPCSNKPAAQGALA